MILLRMRNGLNSTFTESRTTREFYKTRSGKTDDAEHLYFPLDLQKVVMLQLAMNCLKMVIFSSQVIAPNESFVPVSWSRPYLCYKREAS